MSQLTSKEVEMVESVRNNPKGKIWYGDFIAIIDRLSARCEELEREKSELFCTSWMGREKGCNEAPSVKTLRANLSALLEAVEPIESVVKILDGWANAYQATVSLGDLRALSTVAAGIRGGKG